jgi:hypothetical protein
MHLRSIPLQLCCFCKRMRCMPGYILQLCCFSAFCCAQQLASSRSAITQARVSSCHHFCALLQAHTYMLEVGVSAANVFHLDLSGSDESKAALAAALQGCQALVICTSAVPEVALLSTLIGGLRYWAGSKLAGLLERQQQPTGACIGTCLLVCLAAARMCVHNHSNRSESSGALLSPLSRWAAGCACFACMVCLER